MLRSKSSCVISVVSLYEGNAHAQNFPPLIDSLKGIQDVSSINESSEPEEFWEALGGKDTYAEVKKGEELPRDARLFQLSNATGIMRVDEIADFSQSDLIDDDVMILDTYTTVFVWIGSRANEDEKAQAMKVTQEYIRKGAGKS